MQLSTDSTCSASAPPESRLEPGTLWGPLSIEIVVDREFRLRGLALGLFLSAVLWGSAFAGGRELWGLWR
jgi:hypothetical protein